MTMPASVALATAAAIAVQPLWFFVWLVVPALLEGGTLPRLTDLHEFGGLALLSMIVATPFVLLIGLPSGLALRHARRRGMWLALIGFVAAALPVASTPAWDRGVASLDPTALLPLLIAGMHGLIGALAFHAVLRAFERDATRAVRGSRGGRFPT
jgi:hypothetical protein